MPVGLPNIRALKMTTGQSGPKGSVVVTATAAVVIDGSAIVARPKMTRCPVASLTYSSARQIGTAPAAY